MNNDTLAARNGDVASQKNVVATFSLGRCVPVTPLCVALGGRQSVQVFPAAVMRMLETDSAASVFATGSVVIVGCKNEDHALYTAHHVASAMQEMTGISAGVYNFHLRNVVFRVELPFAQAKDSTEGGLNVDLLAHDAVAMACTDYKSKGKKKKHGVSYKPELFPGVAWRVSYEELRFTLTLFQSGRGVATGLRSIKDRHVINRFCAEFLGGYERGNEYRAVDAVNIKSKRKRKRDSHARERETEEDMANAQRVLAASTT